MSTIVCVIDPPDTAILCTDSRFLHGDFSGIADDATQKIFPIGKDAFIATSGRKLACDFQTQKAREIADVLGTSDIAVIGAALEAASAPVLAGLLEILRPMRDERTQQAVSGAGLLHGCVLIGRSGGRLGVVAHNYRVVEGAIVCESNPYFGGTRHIVATCGAPLDQVASAFSFQTDPAIWTDPADVVARRILGEIERVTPESGGADQVACIDAHGSRWICPPPKVEAAPLTDSLTQANISALISINAPTITGGSFTGSSYSVTNANGTITIDATNFLRILTAAGIAVTLDWSGFKSTWLAASEETLVTPTQVRCGPSGSASWISMTKSGFGGSVAGFGAYLSRDVDIQYVKPGGATGTLSFRHGLLANYT